MASSAKMLSLTDAAADRVKAILADRDPAPAGLRISVKNTGCSGMSYAIDYADEIAPGDEVVEDKGVKVCIDPGATLFLIGSELDYVEDKLYATFVFNNPNEKGRCGCGESFHI